MLLVVPCEYLIFKKKIKNKKNYQKRIDLLMSFFYFTIRTNKEKLFLFQQ